jgi:4-hydroxy-3-methylbut-2-enyl diphosphate reductase
MVEDVVDALRRLAPIEVTIMDGLVERVEFRLPAELADCVA